MCEQSEVNYLDGDVVWVKLGSCWWPGEVVDKDKLPPDVLPSFRKPPIAVVKFFQETTYEYVKNINNIYSYNCSRKNEFINKGLYMYRTKHGHMEKFPEDVIRAETMVGGDIEILTRDEFQEKKKESYAGLFGESSKKTPASAKKGRGKGRQSVERGTTPTTPNKFLREKTDYKVHILVQPSKETPTKVTSSEAKDDEKEKDGASPPSTSRAGSEVTEVKPQKASLSTPNMSSPGSYSCPNCSFSTSRLNVLILHNKTHSVTYVPYTPSPVRKKPAPKPPTKSTPKTTKIIKTPRPRKEKADKEKTTKKQPKSKKRAAEEKPEVEIKKQKTDEEIKSSLLADWDDDADDESADETSLLISRSPELPVGSESPAAPTSAELPSTEKSNEPSSSPEKKADTISNEKPEASVSKYDFCEDEDWPIEAGIGRKIPRVKNPSKRKEDTKSLSLDEDAVAKEVAELLNKTAVPELPSVPEPLKVEENFPEPSIVKSPDKKVDNTTSEPSKSAESSAPEPKPTKTIFKTKTFFRSRHSRSQDAIGKYVAEQLNPDRIEMADSDLNGSEAVSSPEARESPPIDHVKVARLAPKIQLKKMKAEAAQLEKARNRALEEAKAFNAEDEMDYIDYTLPTKSTQDVIYPTQEIKPINKETPEKVYHRELIKEPLEKLRNEIKTSNEIQSVFQSDIVSDIVDNNQLSNKPLEQDLLKTPVVDNSDVLKTQCVLNTTKESEIQQNELIHETIAEDINSFFMDYIPKKLSRNKKDRLENQSILNAALEKPAETALILETTVGPMEVDTSAYVSKEELNVIPPKKNRKTEILSSPKSSPVAVAPIKIPTVKASTTTSALQKTYEQLMQPYMSESTASAVDALLSVSREADRVPRIVGSGPPEDLFEDDNKETNNDEPVNITGIDNGVYEDYPTEHTEETIVGQSLNGMSEVIVQETIELPSQDTSVPNHNTEAPKEDQVVEQQGASIIENLPSESDLQIAETLLNLPSTAIQNKSGELPEQFIVPMNIDNEPFEETVIESTVESEVPVNDNKKYEISENLANNEIIPESLLTNNKNLNIRFETEQEKSENLNAAQSLVQMSESIDHKINSVENTPVNNKETVQTKFSKKQNSEADTATTIEQKVESLSPENNCEPTNGMNSPKFETTSKLLKILEEPTTPKPNIMNKIKQASPVKQIIVTGKEKILNFDVAKSKSKAQHSKQKIIIRRAGNTSTKTIINSLNNLGDVVATPDKIILSRTSVPGQDGSSVQTFTIQAPPESTTTTEPKQIVIHPKVKKVTKTKVQKIKPQNSFVQWSETPKTSIETPVTEDAMFDINSMPVVLSEDILTPESIDKMPIVMSECNILPSTSLAPQQEPNPPPKFIKTSKPKIIEPEKIAITPKITQSEKVAISASPSPSKPEVKTLVMNPVSEGNKVTTPNILSKSSKLRGGKPMLVIDKTTGKQKIIMTKAEPAIKEIKPAQTIIQAAPQPAKTIIQVAPHPAKTIIQASSQSAKTIIQAAPQLTKTIMQASPQPGKNLIQALPQPGKNIMQASPQSTKTIIQASPQPAKTIIQAPTQPAKTIIQASPQPAKTIIQAAPQPAKTEKFIILPTGSTSRSGRTQRIVIDPQSGKAHVLVAKGQDTLTMPENKPVSAKLIPSASDAASPGNTVMIITNAQGAQSRIVLTPEHEKILFPNKVQPNVSQIKTITQRVTTNPIPTQKIVTSSVSPVKTPPRIVPKQQKSAIITSKGQLIVGGRVTSTAQNIAPMPETRPASKLENRVPKRIVASEPKKLVQAIQKTTTEPLIFLQQRSGAVMQLTAAQFEHLQRSGQIIHKTTAPPPPENKNVQKSMAMSTKDARTATATKQRVRKSVTTTSTPPAKKVKQEVAIAPSPAPAPVVPCVATPPPLTAISHPVPAPVSPPVPSVSNTVSISTSSAYADLDNLEELLPSTAIVKHQQQPEPPPVVPVPAPAPVPEAEAPTAQFADGQFVAVPGENFGGPPGSFYLCLDDHSGTLTPIDNRPLILENNQLVPMAVEPLPVFAPQPERQDILQAALANSDVFHADPARDDAPDFRDLNANVSVHCRVSETSTTLNQPIMTPVEVPTKGESEPVPSNLEDGLAVIGVTPHTVPTSLELPITVTDPRIAPKTTDPLSNNNYGTNLLPSPNTEMAYVAAEETCSGAGGPISMPLLTDEDTGGGGGGGKSMPILTDEPGERGAGASSADTERSADSPDASWPRRLLTPHTDLSDTSETSAEIPIQPHIQLSVTDLSRHT